MYSVDRISQLPQIILHNILSKLPEEDAARTSVLSKAWSDTWFTFPILSFSDGRFMGTFPKKSEDFLRKRDEFLDYVKRRLLRFHGQGLAIKELKLDVNCFASRYMTRHIDLWMKLVSKSNVEMLEFCLPNDDECYCLPPSILEARSLNKLVLVGGIRVDQAILGRSVKFSLLRELCLRYVVVGDEKAIENLISSCPLIESVTLDCCSVLNPLSINGQPDSRTTRLKSLRILSGPKLKEVNVQGLQEVYVDAPSLENLCYFPDVSRAHYKMNLDKCRNLRGLDLLSVKGTIITDQWFCDLFTKFPFLDSLKLGNCTMSERINISSVKLKVLELDLANCSDLKGVNIDAPSLLSCTYRSHDAAKAILSFVNSSTQLAVNVWIGIYSLNLSNVREFIQNIKPKNVLASLSLVICPPADGYNPDILQVSTPPPFCPSIKHLILCVALHDEKLHLPLVNSLLWSCRPAIISVGCLPFSYYSRAFVELLYELLMVKKEDECFCSSAATKCWWHGLKDVKVTSTTMTDENVDFQTMLDALLTSKDLESFSFRLE